MLESSAQREPNSLADAADFAGENVENLRVRSQIQHRVRGLFRGNYAAQFLVARTSFEGSLELDREAL